MDNRIASPRSRVGLGNAALIACALVLVATDLLVLALALLHERRQLCIVVLGDRLGCHLDLAVTAGLCYALLDVCDGLLKALYAKILVETLRGEDV
jgi:hypothetical protein